MLEQSDNVDSGVAALDYARGVAGLAATEAGSLRGDQGGTTASRRGELADASRNTASKDFVRRGLRWLTVLAQRGAGIWYIDRP
uniref:Uncharacterized protein n=1 Tax=Physcomitrium patens TaxID=3218 RepID=A0A2K1L1Y2_PHYPA|nr:hypothetical protein PHYPA_002838 [Physcomitrium patens]